MCAIWYCVALFAILMGPGGADTMNGFIGAMVWYVTGGRIMPMYLYTLTSSMHRMDTAFIFSCRTMLCSATNIGLPLIWVKYWCSK